MKFYGNDRSLGLPTREAKVSSNNRRSSRRTAKKATRAAAKRALRAE